MRILADACICKARHVVDSSEICCVETQDQQTHSTSPSSQFEVEVGGVPEVGGKCGRLAERATRDQAALELGFLSLCGSQA